MAPIRVPHSNSLIHSSAHAPHRVGIGARADSGASSGNNNNNNSSAVSPPLVVVVVAIGLFSLTMFSMFGRRLLELGGRSSAAAGDTPSRYPAAQTSVQDDRRLFLSQALGLGHTGRLHREPSPARLGAKPKLWDIHIDNQIHAEPRRGQHASLSWDGIMVSLVHF
ncbi:hypothetical protein APHAL10511_006704 [Amanita phalloides]|nr:hypothetical protein APHAL10511_006704 [Amanita phalloides]